MEKIFKKMRKIVINYYFFIFHQINLVIFLLVMLAPLFLDHFFQYFFFQNVPKGIFNSSFHFEIIKVFIPERSLHDGDWVLGLGNIIKCILISLIVLIPIDRKKNRESNEIKRGERLDVILRVVFLLFVYSIVYYYTVSFHEFSQRLMLK
ncbi:MAG: hypothetical protein PHY93_11500 [Bacteriovorax sp.]|nr:hypothetical protein [Bacteriovorax sp.]